MNTCGRIETSLAAPFRITYVKSHHRRSARIILQAKSSPEAAFQRQNQVEAQLKFQEIIFQNEVSELRSQAPALAVRLSEGVAVSTALIVALILGACRHNFLDPLDAYDVSPTEFNDIVAKSDGGLEWLDGDGSNRYYCVVVNSGTRFRFSVQKSDYAVAANLFVIKSKCPSVWRMLKLCGVLWLVDKTKGQFVGDYMK